MKLVLTQIIKLQKKRNFFLFVIICTYVIKKLINSENVSNGEVWLWNATDTLVLNLKDTFVSDKKTERVQSQIALAKI